MGRPTHTRRGAALVLLAAVLALPGTAHAADLTWSDVQVVSSQGQASTNPAIAMNDSGKAVVAWNEPDASGTIRVRARIREPGGNFGDPVGAYTENGVRYVTSNNNYNAGAPQVAVSPNGNVIVAYTHASDIDVAEGTTTLGTPVNFTPVPTQAYSPAVAVSKNGSAIVSWILDEAQPRVEAKVKPAGGAWGATEFVYDTHNETAANWTPVIGGLIVAMDELGNAAFSWTANLNAWNQDPFLRSVYAIERFPNGSYTGYMHIPESTRGNSPGYAARSAEPTRIAMKGGSIIVAWDSSDSSDSRSHVNFKLAGGGWDYNTQTLSPVAANNNGSGHSFGSWVAFDPSGNSLATWGKSVDPYDGNQLSENFRAASAPRFAAAKTITPTSEQASPSSFEFDGRGNAVGTWTQREIDSDGDGDRDADVDQAVASLRSPGESGTWSTSTPISGKGDFANTSPSVQVASNGLVLTAWSRVPTGGGTRQVEVRFGAVPAPPDPDPGPGPGTGDPEPPPVLPTEPPPPPPPPIPMPDGSVNLARPAKSGEAVVLTANTVGPVDRLEWTIPGQPKVTTGVVNGALQNSIRLHNDVKELKVTVKAFGPGGAVTFAKDLTLPRAPTDALSKDVLKGLGKSGVEKVIAAGSNVDVLTGKSSNCAPLSIISGRQTLQGCFKPIEKLADIPNAERGVLDPLSKALGLDKAKADLMNKAVELSDGYLTKAELAIPGGFPVVPKGAASLISFPQAEALVSSNAEIKVGGFGFKPAGGIDGFNLKLDPSSLATQLGKLAKPPNLPKLSGLDFGGDFDIELLPSGEARIKATVKLPSFIKKAGVDVQGSVNMRATLDRIIIDDLYIGPINVNIGALKVDAFQIKYTRATDEWVGTGKACIPLACLDMIPPAGHVTIKDGKLFYAGATLDLKPGSIPIAPGVAMQQIGFGIGLDPARFVGRTRILVGDVVYLDGTMVMGFPDSAHAFKLRRDEVGNGFPAKLYDFDYRNFTIGATADVGLKVTDDYYLELGGGYMLYEYPGYVAVGGHADIAFKIDGFQVIGIRGNIDGEFSAVTKRFNVDGHVYGCVVDVLCAGVDANVSSRGMAVCGSANAVVHEFHVGGAIRWSPKKFIPYLDGCTWDRFREANVRGKAQLRKAQAGDTVATMKREDKGDASEEMLFTGAGGSPKLSVTGPGGEVVSSPDAPGIVTSKDGSVRLMRSVSGNFVAVALAGANKGDYKVEMMPGSPGIAKVEESTALEPAKGAGIVRGNGAVKTLEYDVTKRANQTVRFVDIDPAGAATDIKTINGGGRGKFTFKPKAGKGLHRIEARLEIDGVPAETLPIARYRPPSPVLAKPAGLKVKRSGTKLIVTWKKVSGAASYEIALTPTGSDEQKFFTSKKNSLTIKGVSKSIAGTVAVMGAAPDRSGRASTKKFKRTAAASSGFRDLKDCRQRGKKISCR